MKMFKKKRFVVSAAVLTHLLATGSTIKAKVVSGLPADAHICRIVPDGQLDSYSIVVCSDEFPEVPEGEVIPQDNLVFESL